jgi:hypothetical protein
MPKIKPLSQCREDRLFAPFLPNGQRARMEVSDDDMKIAMIRGRGFHGVITDLRTGKKWRVYGKSCSLPNCMCDASVKPVEATA